MVQNALRNLPKNDGKKQKTAEELKAIRTAAAKNASATTLARNTALIDFALKQLQKSGKEVTAASVAKLASMSESTARDYLQKMKILKERQVMTPQQREMEKRMAIKMRALILQGHVVDLRILQGKHADGKENWVMA
jgi:Fic family protein